MKGEGEFQAGRMTQRPKGRRDLAKKKKRKKASRPRIKDTHNKGQKWYGLSRSRKY